MISTSDEQGQVLDLKQDKKADKNAADDGDDEEEKGKIRIGYTLLMA